MEDNNKAVGSLAAEKLVTLIKDETAKKYDKTGGKIEGSAEITGGLKVGMSSEFSSSIKAGSEISSDMLLMAPIVALHDPATEESISFGVSGENAAKVTSPVSGGGTQYARLAVGTPTGDNDAATKAYVDGLAAAGYEVITVTSTNVSDLGYDAEEGATKYTVFFDASFDSILANLAANKPMKFNITLPDSTGGFPVSFTTGYVSALGNSMYEFTGTLAGAPVVLSIGALGSASVYLYADYLPEPNPDDSDDGKVLAVNKHKWEMKKAVVDDALSDTSTNPVQNKAVKEALDGKLSTRGGEISASLRVGQTVSAEGSVSVGRTSTDTGIHFEKAASDAGRISHGSDPMTGVAPIARLKVADPTDDDDAATKKYVDGRAVRYDAAQGLTSDQKFVACANIGAVNQKGAWMEGSVVLLPRGANGALTINITPIENSNDYMLALDGGPENVPVYVSGLETPTDAQTDCAANVAYVKAKIAEVAASGGVDVDNALSATSTNPVQNKVVTAALTGKAGTAVATASANGLMSKADKAKLDGIADGATQVTIDSAMSGSSNNPVANHVVKQYVDDKVAAAGSNITVDTSLSSTSTNPVQNKAVKAAIDAKADKTALDGKLDKAGGTLTGNLTGKYITGTWLQSTAAANLGKTPGKIAVLDDSGWVYYRTPAELLADIGAMSGGDYYTKAETDAAIAVRASTSAYGTTKLSNSTTSSSKTLAATPYAVKTALEQAKAYVDSAIAVAINSAY